MSKSLKNGSGANRSIAVFLIVTQLIAPMGADFDRLALADEVNPAQVQNGEPLGPARTVGELSQASGNANIENMNAVLDLVQNSASGSAPEGSISAIQTPRPTEETVDSQGRRVTRQYGNDGTVLISTFNSSNFLIEERSVDELNRLTRLAIVNGARSQRRTAVTDFTYHTNTTTVSTETILNPSDFNPSDLNPLNPRKKSRKNFSEAGVHLSTEAFNSSGIRTAQTFFRDGTTTVQREVKFHPPGTQIKTDEVFNESGRIKTTFSLEGVRTREEVFNAAGFQIRRTDFSASTGVRTSEKIFDAAGKKLSATTFDATTGARTREQEFNAAEIEIRRTDFSAETGFRTSERLFDAAGKKLSITTFDPTAGARIREQVFNAAEIEIRRTDFLASTGVRTSETLFDDVTGKKLSTTTFDPTTGARTREQVFDAAGMVLRTTTFNLDTGFRIQEVTNVYAADTGSRKTTSTVDFDSQGNPPNIPSISVPVPASEPVSLIQQTMAASPAAPSVTASPAPIIAPAEIQVREPEISAPAPVVESPLVQQPLPPAPNAVSTPEPGPAVQLGPDELRALAEATLVRAAEEFRSDRLSTTPFASDQPGSPNPDRVVIPSTGPLFPGENLPPATNEIGPAELEARRIAAEAALTAAGSQDPEDRAAAEAARLAVFRFELARIEAGIEENRQALETRVNAHIEATQNLQANLVLARTQLVASVEAARATAGTTVLDPIEQASRNAAQAVQTATSTARAIIRTATLTLLDRSPQAVAAQNAAIDAIVERFLLAAEGGVALSASEVDSDARIAQRAAMEAAQAVASEALANVRLRQSQLEEVALGAQSTAIATATQVRDQTIRDANDYLIQANTALQASIQATDQAIREARVAASDAQYARRVALIEANGRNLNLEEVARTAAEYDLELRAIGEIFGQAKTAAREVYETARQRTLAAIELARQTANELISSANTTYRNAHSAALQESAAAGQAAGSALDNARAIANATYGGVSIILAEVRSMDRLFRNERTLTFSAQVRAATLRDVIADARGVPDTSRPSRIDPLETALGTAQETIRAANQNFLETEAAVNEAVLPIEAAANRAFDEAVVASRASFDRDYLAVNEPLRLEREAALQRYQDDYTAGRNAFISQPPGAVRAALTGAFLNRNVANQAAYDALVAEQYIVQTAAFRSLNGVYLDAYAAARTAQRSAIAAVREAQTIAITRAREVLAGAILSAYETLRNVSAANSNHFASTNSQIPARAAVLRTIEDVRTTNRDAQGRVTQVRTLNSRRQVTQTVNTQYHGTTTVPSTITTLDDQGRVTQVRTFNSDGRATQTVDTVYNSNGTPLTQTVNTQYHGTTTVPSTITTLDDRGRETQVRTFNLDGQAIQTVDTVYNPNGTPRSVETRVYQSDGSSVSTTRDNRTRVTRVRTFGSDGQITQTVNTVYHGTTMFARTITTLDGQGEGRVTEIRTFRANGIRSSQENRQYGADGTFTAFVSTFNTSGFLTQERSLDTLNRTTRLSLFNGRSTPVMTRVTDTTYLDNGTRIETRADFRAGIRQPETIVTYDSSGRRIR